MGKSQGQEKIFKKQDIMTGKNEIDVGAFKIFFLDSKINFLMTVGL